MRIGLTGSDGFTGRHFTAAARRAGHVVSPIRADLTDRDALVAELRASAIDALVHLAAIAFVGHKDDRAFYDVNLFGTMNLLHAVAHCGRDLKRIVIASSANVYGNSPHSPVAETETPQPVNHYAMSKLAMELMARAHHPALPIVFARPFNYTGPGQDAAFVIPKLVDHFRRRAPRIALGNLHVLREYNDVRFVCEAYLRLVDAASPAPVYNVCTGVTYDLHSVLGLLRDMTGHGIEVDVDPRLVRANELHTLCGDPARLKAMAPDLPSYSLRDTLASMLEAQS